MNIVSKMNFATLAFSAVARLALASTLAVTGVACAGAVDEEPTAATEDELIGALTSPTGLEDQHMSGTWYPLETDGFTTEPTVLTFTSGGDGGRRYSVDCAQPACSGDGSWFITSSPLVWFFAGTYVQFRPDGGPDHALFVSRRLSGEIRLVDPQSLRGGRYRNQWSKNPALTVRDLRQ